MNDIQHAASGKNMIGHVYTYLGTGCIRESKFRHNRQRKEKEVQITSSSLISLTGPRREDTAHPMGTMPCFRNHTEIVGIEMPNVAEQGQQEKCSAFGVAVPKGYFHYMQSHPVVVDRCG